MIPILLSESAPAFVAALTVVAAGVALAAPTAFAGNVTLWACHGPTGQPLGAGPLAPSSYEDGQFTTYGSGCSGQAAVLTDGGVVASFGRSDPLAGSYANWRVAVPPGTTLSSVTLDRATRGFGGLPQADDPLLYQASTSDGVLESTSLDDASGLALFGNRTFPVGGGESVTFGVTCGPTASGRCAAPPGSSIPGVDVSAVALEVADDGAPDVAVGGVEDPADGTLPLLLRATDPGLGLASATATLAGEPPVTVSLGGPSCAPLSSSAPEIDLPLGAACPTTVTDVALPVSTEDVGDGPHQLTVTVTDAAGNTTTAVNQVITVRNHLVVPGSSVLLSVGSGGQPAGTPGAPGKGGPGASTVVCDSPQLSVALASRPLGVSPRGRAILWGGTRYLFTGKLTCERDGHRVGAPTNTVVDIRSLVGRRHVPRTGAAVYEHGRFRVLLHPRSTRTIEFRVGMGSAVRQVSINIIVTSNRELR
jgi:hypothetical protein